MYTVISTTGDRTSDHRLQCQNWATSSYRTQVLPNQLVMVIVRPNNLNVSCKLHPYSFQRTRSPPPQGHVFPRSLEIRIHISYSLQQILACIYHLLGLSNFSFLHKIPRVPSLELLFSCHWSIQPFWYVLSLPILTRKYFYFLCIKSLICPHAFSTNLECLFLFALPDPVLVSFESLFFCQYLSIHLF